MNPIQQAIEVEDIRAAGGIVHSDGNIFFTNIYQLRTAVAAAMARAAAAPEAPAQADPCPSCIRGRVCRTPDCGRLKLPVDHPLRTVVAPTQPTQAEAPSEGERRFEELLGKYWVLAYSEGVERRDHDTEDGEAQKTLHELQSLFRAALATQQAEPEVARTPLSISRMACLIDGEARYAYQEIQRLVKTINYMVGIAERGRGVKCPAEEYPEKFLLDYVKELEATQQAGQGELDREDAVLAYLDKLEDDAAVHIWPDDLAKCQTSECVVEVASVRMGSPDGKTLPLFSRDQVRDAIRAARSSEGGSND